MHPRDTTTNKQQTMNSALKIFMFCVLVHPALFSASVVIAEIVACGAQHTSFGWKGDVGETSDFSTRLLVDKDRHTHTHTLSLSSNYGKIKKNCVGLEFNATVTSNLSVFCDVVHVEEKFGNGNYDFIIILPSNYSNFTSGIAFNYSTPMKNVRTAFHYNITFYRCKHPYQDCVLQKVDYFSSEKVVTFDKWLIYESLWRTVLDFRVKVQSIIKNWGFFFCIFAACICMCCMVYDLFRLKRLVYRKLAQEDSEFVARYFNEVYANNQSEFPVPTLAFMKRARIRPLRAVYTHFSVGNGRLGTRLTLAYQNLDKPNETFACLSPLFSNRSDCNKYLQLWLELRIKSHKSAKSIYEDSRFQQKCDGFEQLYNERIEIQGLEELFGIKKSLEGDFVKSVCTFLYYWIRLKSTMDRTVTFMVFVDSLFPLAKSMGLESSLYGVKSKLKDYFFIRQFLGSDSESLLSKMSEDSFDFSSDYDSDDEFETIYNYPVEKLKEFFEKSSEKKLARYREFARRKAIKEVDSVEKEMSIDGYSALSILNEERAKNGKQPITCKDFTFVKLGEQWFHGSLILPDMPCAIEYTGDPSESHSSIREKIAQLILDKNAPSKTKKDYISQLNERLMAQGKKPLSSSDIVYTQEGSKWRASYVRVSIDVDEPCAEKLTVDGVSKGECRQLLARLLLQKDHGFVELDFGPTDVANAIRSALNSSALSSAMKLISFVFLTIFVAKKGEFDCKLFTDWIAAKSQPEVLVAVGNKVLDEIVILFTCAQEFYQTRDWRVFLRNENEIIKFTKDSLELTETWKSFPLMEVAPDTIADFLKKVEDQIKKGIELSSVVKLSAREPFHKCVLGLRQLRLEIIAASRTCNSRTAPFSVMIFGPPKIGKSSIIDILTAQFRVSNPKKMVMPESPDLAPDGVYTRTLKEPYWSGWQSWFWCTLFDDLGQTNPRVPEFALEINELIQVNNNVNFFPPMASVEQKGVVFVAPQLLIATTNNKGLNAYHAVTCPSAVLRRLPFIITPKVKPEFLGPDGGLDGATVNGRSDVWTFDVEEVQLRGPNSVLYNVIKSDIEIDELCAWFVEAAKHHFEGQKNVGDFKNKLLKEGLCEHGVLKCVCKQCIVQQNIQSYDIYSYIWAFFVASWLFMFLLLLSLYRKVYNTCENTDASSERIRVLTDQAFQILAEPGHFVYRSLCGCYRRAYSAFVRRFLSVRSQIVDQMRRCCSQVAAEYVYRGLPVFMAIVSVLIGSLVVVQFFRVLEKHRSDKIKVNAPAGEKPVEPMVHLENPYVKGKIKTFPEIMGSSALTSKPEDMMRMLEDAVGIAQSSRGIMIRTLNVFGRYWLLPKHWFLNQFSLLDGSEKLTITYSKTLTSPMPTRISCFIDSSCVYQCPDDDFVVVRMACAPGKNLIPWIMDCSNGVLPFHGDMIMSHPIDGIKVKDMGRVSFVRQPMLKLAICDALSSDTLFNTLFSEVTGFENGDCGSVLISQRNGILGIVGFHVASVSEGLLVQRDCNTLSLCLPKAWLNEIYVRDKNCVVQSHSDIGRGHIPIKVSPLHHKCPLNFEGLGDRETSILPIGSLNVPRQDFRTCVTDNIFAPFWRLKGYVTNKVAPKLEFKWMPKRNFLMNATVLKDTIPLNLLNKAKEHFINRAHNMVAKEELDKVTVIDEETNLYGVPNNNFINPMDFTTGAGFPYNRPKYKILSPCEREGFPMGTYKLTSELRGVIDEDEKKLEQGLRPNFVFNASLKDEPISDKKLKDGKIRIFQALNFSGLFLLRKYFLSFVALFQTWNFAFENAIGIDHNGPDWDKIYAYLRVDSEWKAFCGDYSNYDQRMGAQLLECAWEVVIYFCLLSIRYPLNCSRILYGLVTECVYLCINFFGDLLMINGTNPSGHALTVVINSIANSIYLRVAWLVIFGDLQEFTENVRVIVYGDDNVVSVSPAYQNRFNLVTVSEALSQFGVVYGDAAKTGVLQPFTPWDEITFLKRRFVVDESEGIVKSPIEKASIDKMLLIGIDNRKVPSEERMVNLLRSSLDEYFQYGEDSYNKHFDDVMECVREYSLSQWIPGKKFPSYYDQLEARRAKKSRIGVLDDVMNQRSTRMNSYQEGVFRGADACPL